MGWQKFTLSGYDVAKLGPENNAGPTRRWRRHGKERLEIAWPPVERGSYSGPRLKSQASRSATGHVAFPGTAMAIGCRERQDLPDPLGSSIADAVPRLAGGRCIEAVHYYNCLAVSNAEDGR